MAKAYGADNAAKKTGTGGVVAELGNGKDAAHGFKGVDKAKGIKAEKTKALDDVNSYDAKNAHNYMAVMSNTMSNKDFQAMSKEGYHPGRMSEAEAVTGLDRIKVVLAKSGVNVAGFTDNIDKDTAAEITGSVAAANAITNSTAVNKDLIRDEDALKEYVAAGLENADLPATDANVRDAVNAFNTAAKIEVPDQGSVEYLLSNAEEPTIENVYMAEHSGSGNGSGGAKGYFDNDGTGYLAEIAEDTDMEGLSEQIDAIIREAGLEADDKIRSDAEYLIKSGFALNPDTLNLYEDIKSISFPLKAGDLMDGIAEAIAEGKSAGNAYLIKGYQRIKNERILNETRLQMNTEANRAINSDNGFALETEELSEKVDMLKDKERAFYRAAFMKDSGSDPLSVEEKISLAEETLFKVSEIKDMPAAVIGSFSSAEAFTVNDIYEAGYELKQKFEAANATYEAVGTEVRADLGDRIGDAFKHAGELLHELGIKETEENIRAVRILGYNSMEINEENIAGVKAADQTVRTLINRLSGAATVSLIREGVNPLENSVQELIDKISEMQGLEGENEKFSEYIFRLERSNDISEDEAESYIGIYRLLRQIENSDGAVIGSLVRSGKELSLRNLLTELRTRGKGHIDLSIDSEFGGVTAAEDASIGMKIDAQIETAFRNEAGDRKSPEERYAENAVHELYDTLSPEKITDTRILKGDSTLEDILDHIRKNTDEAGSSGEILFTEEEMTEIREAVEKEDNVYEMLLRYGQEITPENVNAMDSLMNERGLFFNELVSSLGEKYRESLKSRSEKILERMGGTAEDAGESEDISGDVFEAYGEMADEAEELIREASENADKYLDIKALQSLNRRLTIVKSLSNEENYELPMEIGGKLTSVNVKIIRGTGESKASVSFETEELGKAYAEFSLSGGKISGFASENLRGRADGLYEALDQAGIEHGEIIFEKSLSMDINRIPEEADINSRTPAVLYRTAKIFLTEVSYAH